ncbi:MAG: hypothetical protein V7K46_01655 [Nostoc sp.]
MTYEQVKNLKPEDFKRLCGVRPETFNQMLEIVRSPSLAKQKKFYSGKKKQHTLKSQVVVDQAIKYGSVPLKM